MLSGIHSLLASGESRSKSKPEVSAAQTDTAVDDSDVEHGAAEALLQSVLNGLSFPTLVVSRDGTITHINTPATEFFGVTAAQAAGKTPAMLHDDSAETPLVESALETQEPIQERETTLTIGGSEIPVSRSISLLYDDDGECVGALEIDRDITERREQQARTERLEAYQQARLDDLNAALTAVAAGDLTIDLTTPEPDADFPEIRASYDSFTEMNDQLNAAVANVRSVVDGLTSDAETLSATSQDLSASTEEVTSTMQQIDASTAEMADGSDSLAQQAQQANSNVDDLSASIEEITASLQQIDSRSDEAAALADDGVEDVEAAVEQIRLAADSAADVVDRLDTLESNMDEVENIIGIIADIADQTNILALNANIEAARAGEAGEGFAVVADEVKTLAEETRDSATDVAQIVESLKESTTGVADGIETANDEVRRGADAVETVGERLETISSYVEETSAGVGEISAAVEGQADNAEQISAAIEDTSALAEETAASNQEIAAGLDEQANAMDSIAYTTEELAQMSEELHGVVDRFKLQAEETAQVDSTAAAAAEQRLDDAEGADTDADADEQAQRQTGARTVGGGVETDSVTDSGGPRELQPEDFE